MQGQVNSMLKETLSDMMVGLGNNLDVKEKSQNKDGVNNTLEFESRYIYFVDNTIDDIILASTVDIDNQFRANQKRILNEYEKPTAEAIRLINMSVMDAINNGALVGPINGIPVDKYPQLIKNKLDEYLEEFIALTEEIDNN